MKRSLLIGGLVAATVGALAWAQGVPNNGNGAALTPNSVQTSTLGVTGTASLNDIDAGSAWIHNLFTLGNPSESVYSLFRVGQSGGPTMFLEDTTPAGTTSNSTIIFGTSQAFPGNLSWYIGGNSAPSGTTADAGQMFQKEWRLNDGNTSFFSARVPMQYADAGLYGGALAKYYWNIGTPALNDPNYLFNGTINDQLTSVMAIKQQASSIQDFLQLQNSSGTILDRFTSAGALTLLTGQPVNLNAAGTSSIQDVGGNVNISSASSPINMYASCLRVDANNNAPVQICGSANNGNITIRGNPAGTNVGINLQTSGSGTVQANGVPLITSADWSSSVADTITATGVTGQIASLGPFTNAGTVRAINYTTMTAGGTGTETIHLCSVTGTSCGNFNSYGRCDVACNAAAGTSNTCFVDGGTIAAGANMFVLLTGNCTTTDVVGNLSVHGTTP